MAFKSQVPSVTVTYAQTGRDQRPNELGMRPMQERAYDKRGEQYLLIKSPPASGKSRAPMFIALDKLHNQGLRQAIVVVPERSIGSSFSDEPLSQHGFWADWVVKPNWDPDCGTGDSAAGGLVIFPSNRVRIMVATKPIDFRKGLDGLAALVKNELHKDPFTGTAFVFRSRRADRLKLLYWVSR